MPASTTILVGRDRDLDRLAGAIELRQSPDDSRDGISGGVAVLRGDAGIGKSRLLASLVDEAEAAGWRHAVGHGVGQAGSGLAYLPFIELISAIEALDPDVVERVRKTHPSLSRLTSREIGPEEQSASSDASPSLIAEAVHALFTALGESQPTLLILEDMHWADHSSRDLLTLLLTRGLAGSVALVASYRSDDLHRRHPLHETLAVWDRIPHVTHVALEPLPEPVIEQLVGNLNGSPSDPYTVREIARRADGNPFFAEELAASSAEGHPVTGGLERVLQSRIERLDESTQRVVRAVSLKGGHWLAHDLLAKVMDLSDEELDAAINQAVEHHVLVAKWPPAYSFRHALLGETTADSLLPGERLRLHRAYAAVLAETPTLAPASELARHAGASGDLVTAVAASREAAEQALEVGGPREALQHLERALDWIDEDDPARDDVSLRASYAAMAAGDVLRSTRLLRDSIDHPGRRQSPRVRADVLAAYADRSRLLDLPVDGLALTTEAVGLLGEEVDELNIRVMTAHVQQLVDARRFREATKLSDEVTEVAESFGMARELVELRTIMSRVIEAQYDLDAAEAHLKKVLADGVPESEPVRVRIGYQLAAVSLRRGDLPTTLRRFDETAAIARRWYREWAPWGFEARLQAGIAAYQMGDWDGADERFAIDYASAPQPGKAIFQAAALHMAAGRGESVDMGQIMAIREWWHIDGFTVVLGLIPTIDLLGEKGEVLVLADLVEEALLILDRAWVTYDAVVRIAALVTAQAANRSPFALPEVRDRVEYGVRRLGDRSAVLLAKRITALVEAQAQERSVRGEVEPEIDPDIDSDDVAELDLDRLRDTSRETWAWAWRLRAEQLHYAWKTDAAERPDADAMVAAWERSVAAFEVLGHPYEVARSQARLAAALKVAGQDAASKKVAKAARGVAERLRAAPLLAELDAVWPAGRKAKASKKSPKAVKNAPVPGVGVIAGQPVELTPRETEVLGLVARGMTNGQIGKRLFISTKTVSVHVSNLLAKLGAGGRTEAAAIARERGLLD